MPAPTRFRTLASAIIATVVVTTLAACSGSSTQSSPSSAAAVATPSASATATAVSVPDTCVDEGSASKAITATGAFDSAPTVKFPTPTAATATQKTVLIQGSGTKIKKGTRVELALSGFDAKTGKALKAGASVGYGAGAALELAVDPTQYLPGVMQALYCAQAGSRIAIVVPAKYAFGAAGSTTAGVGKGDSVVYVIDVVALTPLKATGTSKSLPSGFPTVTLASDGKPTVKIPSATPPTKLKLAQTIAGTGETVKSTDQVTVQYQGTLWRTGKVFDQTWGSTTGPASFTLTSVVTGFKDAIVGQKVGSQVVVIVPPAEGYGTAGSSDGTIKGTDTMVFVIDILATTHA